MIESNGNAQTQLAACLVQAHRSRTPAPSGGLANALADTEAAYAVQDQVAAAMAWFGAAPARHWKSGGGSRDAALTHAPLPPHGVRMSPADFSDLALHLPGIEAEIALRLGRDVSAAEAAALTHQASIGLVDAIAVSVEVVASRWLEGSAAPALLRLADLQSHGALALGAWQPFAPFSGMDWSRQRCHVQVGNQAPTSHVGTHPLGDPSWLLPIWLRHLTRHGGIASAGTVVTTGTWCGLVPARPGDQISAGFEGLGEVSLRL